MSVNKPVLDPGLCRCCRSIKKCRILTASYTFNEQIEIYSDMIMDCFGIVLSHTEDNVRDCGVCATCVVRLRDALTFRKQVLQCEELFLQARLSSNDGEVDLETLQDVGRKLALKLKAEDPELPLKIEVSLEDNLMMDDASDRHSDDNNELLPPPSPPVSDDEDDLPLILKATKKRKTKVKGKVKVKKVGKVKKSTRKKEENVPKKRDTDRDLDYMAEENLFTIIENSYVCPFKNRRNNYYCYYCKDYFPKPEDLRSHTESHDTKKFQMLMPYKKMPKIDITRIDCRLCSIKIDDLTAFKTHIETEHAKKYYHEAPEKLLLYRLTWNNLKCVQCGDVFEDFNSLNTHMVEHFSNFTCDICGLCFLEKGRLDAHLKRHMDSEKHACEICGKVFRSNHYKDMHVDIVHRRLAIVRCPKCDECFMSYALKNKHLIEAHGQSRVYPCHQCDKVYTRQKTLTEHQRRNHQKVLKHQCQYCEQRFYLPSRLREHLASHTGERNFRCDLCDKSYPRLKSLQYHARTHSNERLRCPTCAQCFVQASSLKAHIKSHHPENDSSCFLVF